jgi:hypothetical protein
LFGITAREERRNHHNKEGIMKKIRFCLGLVWLAAGSVQSQTTVQTLADYNQWGWEAIVMRNGLITVATVPAIGARVMQYDLGDHPSIYVNSDELGNTYTPVKNAPWHNYGGFKNWPSPQDKWGWPPPPVLDFGAYTAQVDLETPDSVAVSVSSPKEQWLTPNLRFERRTTIFKGTSRVRMEQTLVNEGTVPVEWGVWDITQSIVHHEGRTDYENFWVYFPFSENSVFGANHVKWSAKSGAWKGEVAPGVYGVQFLPEGKKIFCDSPEGWVVYADREDGFIYARTFEIEKGAAYPDGGACVEAWISSDPLYLEVEVLGPVVQIPANGGRTSFTEDWWAAKVRTPVLAVNAAGAIARKMTYNGTSGELSGIYGIFVSGTARVAFLDGDGTVLSEGPGHAVTPLEEFELKETAEMPANAETVEVRIYDAKGALAGCVERAEAGGITGVAERSSFSVSDFRLEQNYPNPFNGTTVLSFFVPATCKGSLKVYDLRGNEIAVLSSGIWHPGAHRYEWKPGSAATGLYLVKLEAGGAGKTLKMTYIK